MRADRPKRVVRIRQTIERDPLIATKLLVAINVVAFAWLSLLDKTVNGGIHSYDLALTAPALNQGEWWRLASYSIVHYGLLHIGFNMLMLWIIGRTFEPATGPIRFTTIYVVSMLGGAAGALVATPNDFTGGASGAILGLAAAATLVMTRRGVRFVDTGFGPWIVIILLFGLFEPHISLGGHIGGLIAGALTAELMIRARKVEMPALGYAGAAAVALLAVAVAYAAAG